MKTLLLLSLASMALGAAVEVVNPDVVDGSVPTQMNENPTRVPTQMAPETESPTATSNPFVPMRPARCGASFNVTGREGLRGYFHSPNFPLTYPANQSCLWKIMGPPGHRLKLTLRTVDTELNYDTLFVHAGCSPHESNRLFSLSGQDAGRDIVFGSNAASVVFSSDAFVAGGGFLATFRFLPPAEKQTKLAAHSGTVLSPGFPAAFQPSAPLVAPRVALGLEGAFAPVLRVLEQAKLLNDTALAEESFVVNVTRGNGMYLWLPESELGPGASVELADVAEHCDADSPRTLQLADNASLAETLYSECSSVRVTFRLPPGQDAKFRLEFSEVCRQWGCYGSYYLGRWASVSLNLVFFAAVLGLLGLCCCCCSSSPRRHASQRRRCRPGRANPAFSGSFSPADPAGPLPNKTPLSA